MNPVEQYLNDKLQERRDNDNLRTLKASLNGIDFCSNDYLGIAKHGLPSQFSQHTLSKQTGSTGSRLLSGNSADAEALEKQLAVFHQTEAALVFNSGYDANIDLFSSIANKHTIYLYDALCHASIIDGIRLSIATGYKFKHNDIEDLETKLKRAEGKSVCIAVESVYSMDGDIAPLQEIAALAKRYGASLIVDEAHATGVFGAKGAGIVQTLAIQDNVLARVHTFGKALGCHGAVIVSSTLVKEYLTNFARSFIYTTALPPHSISAIANVYTYLQDASFNNKMLHDIITYFRKGIASSPSLALWRDSISPIQILVLGNNEKAKN